MTIKELKNNILLSLYHRYKDNKLTHIGLKDLCAQDKLTFDTQRQVTDAARGLKEDGYIQLHLYTNGDGLIYGLTPSGIEYIEEYLLPQDEHILDEPSDVPKDIPVNNSTTDKSIKYFTAQDNYKIIVDGNATPCFGVDSVADCYAKQLDKIASSEMDTIRMLGIFGPWGRGKTYFYNRLKKNLEDTNQNTLKYKFVEFNAWKYQDTPALWAYLYETIYKSTSCWEKFINQIHNSINKKKVLIYIIVFFICWGIGWIISFLSNEIVCQILDCIKFPVSAIYLFSGFLYLFVEKPATARELIKKYTKRKSYKNYLGIQNEIEEDLHRLMQIIVSNPLSERLVLYVDDIDRCNSKKMINLIDSLRTVLENQELQKRLIVICSVDEKKLLRAYTAELTNNETDSEEASLLAREHLDKLFIFGIKLAALDSVQQYEYLKTLIKDSNSKSKNIDVMQDGKRDETPFSTFRHKDSFVVTSALTEIPELNDRKIEELFHDFLQNYNVKNLTPRKIRIMYYQLLFAINISSKGGGAFMDNMVEAILKKSAGLEYKEDTEIAMSDIIEMAVPY